MPSCQLRRTPRPAPSLHAFLNDLRQPASPPPPPLARQSATLSTLEMFLLPHCCCDGRMVEQEFDIAIPNSRDPPIHRARRRASKARDLATRAFTGMGATLSLGPLVRSGPASLPLESASITLFLWRRRTRVRGASSRHGAPTRRDLRGWRWMRRQPADLPHHRQKPGQDGRGQEGDGGGDGPLQALGQA